MIGELPAAIDQVRRLAIASAPPTWPALATVIEQQLAEPFPPLGWLPLAFTRAAGASIDRGIPFCVAWALGVAADRHAPASPRAANLAEALRQLAALVLRAMPAELGGDELVAEQAAVAVQRAAGRDRELAGEADDLHGYTRIVQDRSCTSYVFAGLGGARAAGAEPAVIQACREAGYHLGMAVQLRRDVESARSATGDLVQGVRTFPIWYGLLREHAASHELRGLVFDPAAAAHARRIRALLDELDAFRLVLAEADREHRAALAALARCPGDAALAIACTARLLDPSAGPPPRARQVPRLQLR